MIVPTTNEEAPREIRSPFSPAVTRWLRVLFLVITCLMALFAIGGFFMPREMRVERSLAVAATPDQVFDRIQSFRKWEDWAPWFRRDPFLEKRFSGPDAGMGALMEWASKNDGTGKIKIIAARGSSRVNMAIDFGEYGEGQTWFELTDAGSGQTTVTWGFSADFGQNLARRYFGLFFRGKVAADFDEGLRNLRELVQLPASK